MSFLLVSLSLFACGTDPRDLATEGVKEAVDAELDAFVAAATAIQADAPVPDADGWNADADADAVEALRSDWRRARIAYERVEGAIAVLFPDLDAATDERYDGFLGEGPDDNLFDGEGVTGVHGIERILWSNAIPDAVVTFESTLDGYTVAAFPANESEATDFRDGLAAQLVTDATTMRDDFLPLALDPAAAYEGVVGSMAEQVEKITLATTGESESRYAQHTLADMRANLEGGKAIFLTFEPWLEDVGATAERDAVLAGFDRVEAAYAAVAGESLPPVPEGWDPSNPSAEQLATPYGALWSLLSTEADPDSEGSLVASMVAAAGALEIPLAP